MMSVRNPRLLRPAITAVGGSAIALAALTRSGWGAAFVVESVTVAAAFGYYVLGGNDSDLGAVIGSKPDERQAGIGLRARALAGWAMGGVAVLGFLIETARGRATGPFELICVVGAASFVAGLVIYRS